MEDSRFTRFWREQRRQRPRTRIRSQRAEKIAEATNKEQRGPYETSYDVRRGYSAERSIVRP